MTKVELSHVSKEYNQVEVLRDISLKIGDSELLVLVGPSGCGKSTLLRSIAGFETLSGGDIWINGVLVNETPPNQRGVAMVFQNYALYPHMSVTDNIGFGLRNLGTPKDEVKKRVHQVAEVLQIKSLLNRKPNEISGGQRQRVAIGRAIVKNPQVFLFDEPLSNLDASLRSQMRIEIAKVHQLFPSPIIYVTHDQVEAMTLADRIAVLNLGIVEQIGSPMELYHRPKNLFVAGFLGSPAMNFIPGELIDSSVVLAQIRVFNKCLLSARVNATSLSPGAPVTIGIRPENVRINDLSGQLTGKISLIERLGNRVLIYINLNSKDHLIVEPQLETPFLDALKIGDSIFADLPAEVLYLFDKNGMALPRVAHRSTRSA
ncbi:MAG: ABC transporter ATP-binding protein [Bdellovibrionia bacterium]